jgi:PAS domain S-box-containing protein
MPPHKDATTAGGSLSQPQTKSEKMPRLGKQPRQMALALTGAQLLWTLPPDSAPQSDDVPAAWCAYTGQTSEQIVHSGLREVLHPEDRRATLASIQRAVVRQQPYHLVTRLRRWDGVYQPFVVHGVPQRTATGHLRQWVGTLTNVTTYAKALLDQESTQSQVEPDAAVDTPAETVGHQPAHLMEAAQLRATFDALADGLFVFDQMGQALEVNPAGRALLSLEALPRNPDRRQSQRLGRQLDTRDAAGQLLPREQWPLFRALRGETLTGSGAVDMRFRALDGRELYTSISAAPIWDEQRQVAGAVLAIRDVTEHRALEQELAKWAASLSDANWRLDESLHIVAHELRTPLTSLKGLLDVVERRLKQETPAVEQAAAVEVPGSESGQLEQTGPSTSGATVPAPTATGPVSVRPLLQRANQQAVRLGRLLDDLTDAARAQTGKLEIHPEPCDLRSVVQSGVAEQRQATKRSIHLQMPKKPVEVAADIGRINQALSNYLTNAAKYSPKESPIDVSLSIEHGQARVAVADRGQGLMPEAQARIWERFHQANSVQTGGTARSSAGLGLGLYISKHLIEHHGGAVGVVSMPGQGSTFWFTLPLAAEPEPDVSAPQ